MHAAVNALNVHSKQPLELFLRGRKHITDGRDAGVVDQDVDRRLAADGSDDLVDSTMIGDIAGVKMEAVTRVARFDVKHVNGGPVIGELLRDCLSDTFGSARDDRYLIFQSHDR